MMHKRLSKMGLILKLKSIKTENCIDFSFFVMTRVLFDAFICFGRFLLGLAFNFVY
jgi:hypothetical protein